MWVRRLGDYTQLTDIKTRKTKKNSHTIHSDEQHSNKTKILNLLESIGNNVDFKSEDNKIKKTFKIV